METINQALEVLLVAAQHHNCLKVGIYESAEFLNLDPDGAALCVLAADEEDEDDPALQIHFTLLQAFCYDNYIDVLRVFGMKRLAQLLHTEDSNGNQTRDLHCILVTNPPTSLLSPALRCVARFCEESRSVDQWVPCLELTGTGELRSG